MLQLRSAPPELKRVRLTGGASVMVRPATQFEHDLAAAKTGKMLAGLVQSHENASLAADLLGPQLANADFTSREWIEAAAKGLILIELAETCVVAWDGFVDDAGHIIEKPSRGTLALLLRNASAASLIERAIRADISIEYDEKNASGALPNGEAPVGVNTAPSATNPERPAPQA